MCMHDGISFFSKSFATAIWNCAKRWPAANDAGTCPLSDHGKIGICTSGRGYHRLYAAELHVRAGRRHGRAFLVQSRLPIRPPHEDFDHYPRIRLAAAVANCCRRQAATLYVAPPPCRQPEKDLYQEPQKNYKASPRNAETWPRDTSCKATVLRPRHFLSAL